MAVILLIAAAPSARRLRRALESTPTLLEAKDGAEGLAFVSRPPPDLVIWDLPRLTDQAAPLHPTARLLVLTAPRQALTPPQVHTLRALEALAAHWQEANLQAIVARLLGYRAACPLPPLLRSPAAATRLLLENGGRFVRFSW